MDKLAIAIWHPGRPSTARRAAPHTAAPPLTTAAARDRHAAAQTHPPPALLRGHRPPPTPIGTPRQPTGPSADPVPAGKPNPYTPALNQAQHSPTGPGSGPPVDAEARADTRRPHSHSASEVLHGRAPCAPARIPSTVQPRARKRRKPNNLDHRGRCRLLAHDRSRCCTPGPGHAGTLLPAPRRSEPLPPSTGTMRRGGRRMDHRGHPEPASGLTHSVDHPNTNCPAIKDDSPRHARRPPRPSARPRRRGGRNRRHSGRGRRSTRRSGTRHR